MRFYAILQAAAAVSIGVFSPFHAAAQSSDTAQTSGTGTVIRGVVRSVSKETPYAGILRIYENTEQSFDKIYTTPESQPRKQLVLKNLNIARDFEFHGKPAETTFVLCLTPEKTTILYQSYDMAQILTKYASLHSGVLDTYTLHYPPFEKNSFGTFRHHPDLGHILLWTPEIFQRKNLLKDYTKTVSKVENETIEKYTLKPERKNQALKTSPTFGESLIYTIPDSPVKPIRLEQQWKTEKETESSYMVFPQTQGNPIETTSTILVDGFLSLDVLNAKSEIKIFSVTPGNTVPEVEDFENTILKKSTVSDFRIRGEVEEIEETDIKEYFAKLAERPSPIEYPYGPPKSIEELKTMDKIQNPPKPKSTPTPKPGFLEKLNRLF